MSERRTEVENLLERRKVANSQGESIELVSDLLSTRLETYEEGLDKEIVSLFDPVSKRSNYLLIQDELCDLVLDERPLLSG